VLVVCMRASHSSASRAMGTCTCVRAVQAKAQ
jgi:hypothetical protein